MLGEFGGSIGRGSEARKGAGLLEKEEEDLLWISEEKGEGLGVGILWDLGFSPGCQGGLSGSLLLLSLLWSWRVQGRRMEVVLDEEKALELVSGSLSQGLAAGDLLVAN